MQGSESIKRVQKYIHGFLASYFIVLHIYWCNAQLYKHFAMRRDVDRVSRLKYVKISYYLGKSKAILFPGLPGNKLRCIAKLNLGIDY